MKRNNALLIVIAIVLVLSLCLAACNKKDAPPQDEKATYSVSIPSGEGYTVVGAANVKEGEDYSFQVNIANGYNGTDMVVKVNGNTVVKTGNAYVVNSVSGNLVITVTGVKKNAPDTYTVTLPSGNGFTASGETTATAGSNYSFTVTVATGYDVSSLVVKNGEATLTATSTEGNVVTYTINNVQSNITLTATIAKLKFSVTLPTGEGYAVVGESEAVYGEDYTFTVNAVAGYSVKDAVVKSGDVTLTGVNGTYTVANVTANVVITVENVVKLQDYVSVTTRVYDLKLADITDAQKAAAYYMTGVSGVYKNETCEVSADLSAVDFTRAGTYTITYKLVGHETVTETATVNVYGEPTITVASDAIKTVVWSKNLDLNAFINTLVGKISAVDSLNNALTVNVKAATVPAKNAYGFYDIQSYNVTFTATDKMGNLAEETVQITITGSTAIEVAPTMSIDLANTSVMLAAYEAGVDFDLFKYDSENGLVAITTAQAAWDSDKQGTFFAPSYLTGLTLGEHTFVLVFEDTFKVVALTLTDNQEPAFTTSDVTELAYLVGEEFVLPTAVKSANSAQAITVKYFLGSDEFTANPTVAGSYTYTIKFFRNNEELTEYAKEYSLVLVNNYGWSGATVSATKDGKVALSGVFKEGTAYVDSNPILSAEYISANKGENNIVVVTLKVLDQGTNNSTVEGYDRGIWYVKGVDYITEATHPVNYVGVTPKTGDEYTMKLRIEENGTATFILRNFDGKVEVTSVGFEYHKEYVEDPNFTKGYAESVELTYNDEQTRINSAKIVVPAGNAWWTDSPALSATYIKTLCAAGVRYIEIAPTFTTKDSEAFIYQYYDAAQGKNVEFTNLSSGQTVLFALTDEKQIALSKVDTKGGQGKTAADTINVAFTYYTQEEYDAAQAEIAKKEARARLAAITKLEGNFWNYFHHGGWGVNNWGENNKVVKLTSNNFTLQKALIDDAKAAGYKYMVIRIKANNLSSDIVDNICFTSMPNWDFYWGSYVGYDVAFRLDLSKYFDGFTFGEDGNVMKICARTGDNENGNCSLDVEIIGFEEDNDKHFVTIGSRWDYKVTGDTYAEIGDGESASFTIKATDAYTIDSITCDGATVTREGDVWTVSNATKDSSLNVTTHRSRHNVIISQGTGFTADAYNKQVDEGNNVSFTITANTDWAIDNVTCDDANVTITNEGDVWTFSNVTKDIAVTVKVHSTAAVDVEYKVTVAGEGFDVAETLPAISLNGADVALKITVKDGYRIDNVTANNGATVNFDGNYYIIGNITADTEVTVATTNLAQLVAEAEARLAATMKSSGGFWNYFRFGGWGTNTWDNGIVNITSGNITIQRNLIDDALLAGYTHMKFHLVAVAEDGSTVGNITMITNGEPWNYYWKQYSGSEADVRIDLSAFAKEGHTTDYLTVNINNTNLSSNIVVSAVEFFKSEETTTWTKSASNVYIANENGTLVLDTVCAGNDAFAESDAEWFAKYFGQGNGVSQRTLKVVECATIYNGSNTRNMLYGWDGENKSPLPASGYLNNFTGSTLRLAFDKDGVAQVKFDNVYANRNEWTTQFTHTDNTITVSNTCNNYELFFNNLDELKEKYESITFTITDTSALNGIVWFYYNDAALPINSSDNANPKTITLSEATRLMIHFTAVENITITYTLNPKSAN